MASEAILTAAFCALIGGVEEVRHTYEQGYIQVDCETVDHVIEAGLDKRSSLDSIQQAVFAHTLTGKIPVIVMYDTNGREGKYEYRIRTAAEALNVPYITVDVKDMQRPIELPSCGILTPTICSWHLSN